MSSRILSARVPDSFEGKGRTGRAFLGYMIVSARRGYHADSDAVENRARPLLPCAPAASDVFAYSEHAARRVGCIGACLVSKVKNHSVSARMG